MKFKLVSYESGRDEAQQVLDESRATLDKWVKDGLITPDQAKQTQFLMGEKRGVVKLFALIPLEGNGELNVVWDPGILGETRREDITLDQV